MNLFHAPSSVTRRGFLFLVYALWLWGCANPVSPRGGPRDETPPKVVLEKSTPNLTTNFNERRIILTFDEWVKLNDVFNQVVISPPLQENPEIRLNRKKGVVVEINEALRPNTTYTINFGDAVQDITESNKAENLRFVFSTGSFIDSLVVGGVVSNALTGSPQKDVLFMLYENAYDSIVYQEKPLYFSKTDQSGRFKIENVKSGSFKAFALVDGNFNYLYDLPSEIIGFQEEEIVVNDTTTNQIRLDVFESEPDPALQQRILNEYGKVQLFFNRPPDSLDVQLSAVDFPYFIDQEKNDLILWYHSPDTATFELYLDYGFKDTLIVNPVKRLEFLQKDTALLVIEKPARGKAPGNTSGSRSSNSRSNKRSTPSQPNPKRPSKILNIHPDLPAELFFNHPVLAVDTSAIYLLEDTSETIVKPTNIQRAEVPNQLSIYYSWKEGVDYQLIFPKGSLTDMYGFTCDTTRTYVTARERKDYGAIISTIENLDSTSAYIIELLDSKNNSLDEYTVSFVKTAKKTYNYLLPGNYKVKITEDRNNNGKWDTGDYALKRQPEKISIQTFEPLRANWEVDGKIIY